MNQINLSAAFPLHASLRIDTDVKSWTTTSNQRN